MNVDNTVPAPSGDAASGDASCFSPQVGAALSAMEAAVDVLAGLDVAVVDGRVAAVVARRLAVVASRAVVARVRLLPVIDTDGLWALSGARSFPVWVSHEHQVSVQTARAQVRLGRALRDHLPATAAAAATGAITVEQAQVLATLTPTTAQRRQVLADPAHECNEAFLVDQAARLSVDETRVLARQWAAYADPDADDRGYVESGDREHLELSRMGDGYHLEGQLTIEHGQTLKAALAAVTPVPAVDDDRTPTQRRAHALADLATITLDHGLIGTGRAVRPRVTVLVDEPTFRARAEAALARLAPARPEQGTRLEQTANRTGGPVSIGSTPPAVTAAMLTGRAVAGGPQYEDRTPVPRALLDRIACDSEINRIIFGPHAEVLDVGRAERTFTRHRRAAITARDKHCQYPTCTAPPPVCEAHHVQHWARDHGATKVDNGILLCTYHHGLIHRREIQIHRHGKHWTFHDTHGTQIDPERVRPRSPSGRGTRSA
ncbi:HNH endonuclease signature motif containing protein [uncultured Cellulomonas sp.]|uniref:HNH endonuclease signature motif containing protein n=1 Tax=uncultured Cellulomonas sp. TaxID=189682 RepID=UPI002605337D|nr:HNH endonuclease signature motif containing protein [uncultured Cellulomonas sp.]